MPDNEPDLLNRVFEDQITRMPEELASRSDQFVYFSAEQILKDYDLSADELVNGITDGEGDGGIDAIYTFANGRLQDDDDIPTDLQINFTLELYVIQAKEGSFAATALALINDSVEKLLSLSTPLTSPEFNPRLIDRVSIFRNMLGETAIKFPRISIKVVYPANKPVSVIAARVIDKAGDLKEKIEQIVGGNVHVDVAFMGSGDLLDAASRQQSETLELRYDSNIEAEHGYIALVPVQELANFVSDERQNLKRYMFEANVRDYQGKTTVNKSIIDSLENISDNPDFWWLNNGITILSSQVRSMSRKFIIKDPQIVNGLQTSESIFRYFNDEERTDDDRLVMVKILETDDEDTRNSVIVATNSQNTLPAAAVRAGDRIQKHLEQYFLGQDYFYDRRKNYYKNQKKPAAKIFGIPFLAQAALSIGFNEPDTARARPSNVMKSDSDYKRVFSNRIELKIYLWMAQLQREVDVLLRASSYSQEFKSSMRFHLAMLVARRLTGMTINHPSQISSTADATPDVSPVFDDVAEQLNGKLTEYEALHPGMRVDAIAKSKDFVEFLD